jgi:hypothetical protein
MDERRTEPRYPYKDQVLVTIRSAGAHTSEAVRTVTASARDVSTRGICVTLEHAILPGTALDLWVKVMDQPGTLSLRGRVKWNADAGGGQFKVGIEFAGQDTNEWGKWADMIIRLHSPKKP